MRRLLFIFFFIPMVIVYSCSNTPKTKEARILSETEMQAVLWDVLQANAFTQNFIARDSSADDSLQNAILQEKIFVLHKISREDFYTSYRYYMDKPGDMKKILDSVVAKAERNRTKIMQERYARPAAMVN